MYPLFEETKKEIQSLLPQLKRSDFLFLSNKKICIIGASGLIGSYLTLMMSSLSDFFNLGIRLVLGGRQPGKISDMFSGLNNSKFEKIDLLDQSLSLAPDIDFIVDSGSLANPLLYATKPVETFSTNVFGCFSLLNYCKDVNKHCRLLYISSGEVYGSQKPNDERGYIESQPGVVDSNDVRSCYTEGKRASETLCKCYHSEYGVDVVLCRSCFVFGPTYSENDSRVVFQFIRNALNGDNIVLKSDGLQVRSYLYVFDACIGILLLLRKGVPGESYNLASSTGICSIRDLASTICFSAKQILGKSLQVISLPPSTIEKKGFSPFQWAVQNPEKILSLGFSPIFSIPQGVFSTLQIRKAIL